MPVMLLPFLPMTTVIMGMFVITSVKCTEFDCADLVKDTLECDIRWCYENGGCACCCCCTVCHNQNDDDDEDNTLYDDSSASFHAYAYAKKS